MKNLDQIIEEARRASTTGLARIAKSLEEDPSATMAAGLVHFEESAQAYKRLMESGSDLSRYRRLLREQVVVAGSYQAWIDARARERGFSLGDPTANGRHVKVFISTLAYGEELTAVREMIATELGSIATARIDIPSAYPEDLVRDSEIVVGDRYAISSIHCVVVPAALRNYAR